MFDVDVDLAITVFKLEDLIFIWWLYNLPVQSRLEKKTIIIIKAQVNDHLQLLTEIQIPAECRLCQKKNLLKRGFVKDY